MERTGTGAKSARALQWIENERESFQHHADYLKRLSKLREELLHQEQANLANALDRLRMKSYGKEFAYSRAQRDRRSLSKTAQSHDYQGGRRSLVTTFEQFQRMRPKKVPATILPLEGKSLIETPSVQVTPRERLQTDDNSTAEKTPGKSVEESVRLNLQRLSTNPTPRILRQRTNTHRDITSDGNTSWRRQHTISDLRNSLTAEDRISHMQRQKQKLMKLRHEAREAEKIKLAPQSFQLDTLNDEDRMNLEKLKDYYCIYYVPAPASSPVGDEPADSVHLPAINCLHNQEHAELHGSPPRGQRNTAHGNRTGFKITTDNPIPPTVCNGTCRMYVSGNKLESSVDNFVDNTDGRKRQRSSGSKENRGAPNGDNKFKENKHGDISNNGSNGDKGNKNTKTSNTDGNEPLQTSQEKMQIRVTMPSILFNAASPEHQLMDGNTNLVKAFKQKELRQREFSNLMEDVRELNMRTESLTSSIQ